MGETMKSTNNMKHRHLILAHIAALCILAGCASLPIASPEEDARAKSMQVPDGKALVYIYRSTTFGLIFKPDLLINGQMIGENVAMRYYLLEVPPGVITITSQGTNTVTMDLRVDEGLIYYVRQQPSLYGLTDLIKASEEDGKKALKKCKLVKFVKL